MNTEDRYLDIKGSAKMLGVGENTIRRRIADGSLPAYRVGSASDLRSPIRIRVADLEALLTPIHPDDPRGEF